MKILDFALVVGKLKGLKRTGWVRSGIPNPESVADHTLRLTILAMFLAPTVGANSEKSVKMALIHDLAEATTGDIVTNIGTKSLNNHKEKVQTERAALKQILSLVDAHEYNSLFEEYLENETVEAQLVHQLDKLEMAIQAYEYEHDHKIKLNEFFVNARLHIQDAQFIKIMDEIEKLRL